MIKFQNKNTQEQSVLEKGLPDYLAERLGQTEQLPKPAFSGSMQGETEAVDWAVTWLPEGGDAVGESYVNLIPTAQGGTYINGFRQGLSDSIREWRV